MNENEEINEQANEQANPNIGSEPPKRKGKLKQAKDNAKQKAKDAIKKAVKRALRAIWTVMPIYVKIFLIIVLVIIILILFIIIIQKEFYEAAETNISSSASNITVTATDTTNDTSGQTTTETKEQRDENDKKTSTADVERLKSIGSLLSITLSDINAMYDDYMNTNKGTTKNLMQTVKGSNDVSSTKDSRIVSIDDKLEIYKHVLLTEKYNFNNIKWKEYGHDYPDGKDITNLTENKEKGLKYPNDSEVGLSKFVDMTLPYLQTWRIPITLGMASLNNDTSTGDSKDVNFIYNIIKEAQSDIQIDKYNIQKYTLVTWYLDYMKKTYHSEFSIGVEYIEQLDDHGNIINRMGKVYKIPENEIEQVMDSAVQKNTRINKEGQIDPMRETKGYETVTSTSQYYLKSAKTFDSVIENEYTYTTYNDDDASSRKNADSESADQKDYYDTEDEGNKIESFYTTKTYYDVNSIDDVIDKFKAEYPQIASVTINTTTSTGEHTTTTVASGKVASKPYVINDGYEYTVTRTWSDKLTVVNGTTRQYTYDDFLEYLKTKNIDESSLTTSDKSYYKKYGDNGKLNRVDFINAVPDIFDTYVSDGMSYSENIGYSRSYLSVPYGNLKDAFQDVVDSNGTLPYNYGRSLGFDKIYSDSLPKSVTNVGSGNGFGWPVDLTDSPDAARIGYIFGYSDTYGCSSLHSGIDIWNDGSGSNKIIAAKSGTIITIQHWDGSSTTGMQAYGNYVAIDHGDGYVTRYGHLSSISSNIKVGDVVDKGTVLGVMGTTGNSTGVHLHFEIVKDSERQDPIDYYNVEPDYEGSSTTECISVSSVPAYKFVSEKGSGQVLTEATPKIRERKKQDLLDSLRKKNANWANSGAWTLEYYKNNDAELMARMIVHELGLNNDSYKGNMAAVSAVKAHAIVIKNRMGNYGSVYNAFTASGQWTNPSGERFNATPVQWIREIAAAFVGGYMSLPPGATDDLYFTLGRWDEGSGGKWLYTHTEQVVAYKWTSDSDPTGWSLYSREDAKTANRQTIGVFSEGACYLNKSAQDSNNKWLYIPKGEGVAISDVTYPDKTLTISDVYSDVSSASSSEKSYSDFTIYKQASESWGSTAFSGGTIGSSGCSLTATSIILSGYGYKYNPGTLLDAAKKSGKTDFYLTCQEIASYFSNNEIVTKGKINTEYKEYDPDESKSKILKASDIKKIKDNLNAGRPVIILVQAGGKIGDHQLTCGHYMTLLDIKQQDGKTCAYVGDPGWSGSNTDGWKVLDLTNGKIDKAVIRGYVLIK